MTAGARIADEIGRRPVYLASLSEGFYRADELLSTYCIYPEFNLYRIAILQPEGQACLGAP